MSSRAYYKDVEKAHGMAVVHNIRFVDECNNEVVWVDEKPMVCDGIGMLHPTSYVEVSTKSLGVFRAKEGDIVEYPSSDGTRRTYTIVKLPDVGEMIIPRGHAIIARDGNVFYWPEWE